MKAAADPSTHALRFARLACALAFACTLPVHAQDHAHDAHAGHAMHAMPPTDAPKPDAPGSGAAPSPAGTQVPKTPIPPITDEDRAAAASPGHGHEHGRTVFAFLMVDRLERWNEREGGEAWGVKGWIGGDAHRLWLRSEGEREAGRLADADLEVLYGRPVARWWDVQAGVRRTFGPGPSRTAAALGVSGIAPGKFEIEATGYLDTDGRVSARAEAAYTLLLTNRLVLEPRIEANWQARDDRARGIGAGVSSLEGGLRLRYELDRRFAPYVGVVRTDTFGTTADLRRAEGEAAGETRVVLGVRLRF
jgi:copper resistance protein B